MRSTRITALARAGVRLNISSYHFCTRGGVTTLTGASPAQVEIRDRQVSYPFFVFAALVVKNRLAR